MRDKRFIAKHRGGFLEIQQHKSLIRWACQCVEHTIKVLNLKIDDRLTHSIDVAKAWEKGYVRTGEAMKAAVMAHAVARESSDPVQAAIARAIGHAVATAHMSDHSLGGSLYSLKAINYAGLSIEKEMRWHNKNIPQDLKDLVLSTLRIKGKSFKLKGY